MIELIGIACIVVLLLIGGLAVAFEKGWIGLSPERIAKIHAKADTLQAKLEAKLAKKAKAAAPVAVAAAPIASPLAARIAELQASLDAKEITPMEFETAKAAAKAKFLAA